MKARVLVIPVMVAGAYVLVGAFWGAGGLLSVAWGVLSALATFVAAAGEQLLHRRGSLLGALAILSAGPLFASIVALVPDNKVQPTLPFAVCGCHAVAAMLALDRASRPGGVRAGDARLVPLLWQLRTLSVVAFVGWLFFLGLVTRLTKPQDFTLTAWLGLCLAWWVLESVFDKPSQLAQHVKAFFKKYPLEETTREIDLKKSLKHTPAVMPSDLPRDVYHRAAKWGEEAEEEGFNLLTRARCSLRRLYGRDWPAIASCLKYQRRLTESGLKKLLDTADEMRDVDRLLLLRQLLIQPPKEHESADAPEWITREIWHNTGDLSAAAEIATISDSIRHDVIKHGLAKLDPVLDRARSLEYGESLPSEEHQPLHAFVDQLIGPLDKLNKLLGPRLFYVEIREVKDLKEADSWGRARTTQLEEMSARLRRILEQLTAQIRLVVPDLIELIVVEQSTQGVPIELTYDPDRKSSMTVVTEPAILQTIVRNLIGNAVEAARDTPPTRETKVWVVLEITGDPRNPLVEIRVEDSGPGIEPVKQREVRPPSRGLSLVEKALLKLHGEKKIERSELGGAAIIVRIPRSITQRGDQSGR